MKEERLNEEWLKEVGRIYADQWNWEIDLPHADRPSFSLELLASEELTEELLRKCGFSERFVYHFKCMKIKDFPEVLIFARNVINEVISYYLAQLNEPCLDSDSFLHLMKDVLTDNTYKNLESVLVCEKQFSAYDAVNYTMSILSHNLSENIKRNE